MTINPFQVKKVLEAEKKEALVEFLGSQNTDIQGLTHRLSDIVDKHIQNFADEYLGDFKDKVALVYTGSNGRREVCPYSDLDIFLLLEDSIFDGSRLPDDLAEPFGQLSMALSDTRLLQDGLKPRNVEHCIEGIQDDQEIWTQFIDRRKAWGSDSLYQRLNNQIAQINDDLRPDFIQAKFDEYDTRFKKPSNARFSTTDNGMDAGRYAVIEPNVKDGYGGLRAIQTARWVSQEQCGPDGCDLINRDVVTQDDEDAAKEAYNFVLTVRCHLHDIANKEDDVLRAHYQPEIASRMGYESVESFMKDYIAATRESAYFAKMVCADVAEQLNIKAPGDTSENKIMFKGEKFENPMQVLELLKQYAETGLSLHHKTMNAIRKSTDLFTDDFVQNPAANRVLLDILSHENGKRTIFRMKNLGVLGKMIPEFDKVKDLALFDPYHAYTVDDHSIVAIANISAIAKKEHEERSPVSTEIAQSLTQEDREVLAVSLLLHDVRKADQPDDVKSYNRGLAQRVSKRMGLENSALDMTVWLTENHMLLKDTARFRDIEDPKTIKYLSSQIPTIKHLDLLRVMSLADSLALGNGRLSSHATYRVDTIYEKTKAMMSGLSPHYNHQSLQLPADYKADEPYVSIIPNQAIGADILTVIAPDKPFLLENIMVALEKTSGDVLNARITTLEDDCGSAMNVFMLQNSRREMHTENELQSVKRAVLDAVKSSERLKPTSSPKDKILKNPANAVFTVPPQIEFTNSLSSTNTSIKITANEQPYLLHRITSAFNESHLNTRHASSVKKGPERVHVIEVCSEEGGQIPPSKQKVLHDILMGSIFGVDEPS